MCNRMLATVEICPCTIGTLFLNDSGHTITLQPYIPVVLFAAVNRSRSLCQRDSVNGHNEVFCRGGPEQVSVGGRGRGSVGPPRHQLQQPSLQTLPSHNEFHSTILAPHYMYALRNWIVLLLTVTCALSQYTLFMLPQGIENVHAKQTELLQHKGRWLYAVRSLNRLPEIQRQQLHHPSLHHCR